MFAGVETWLYQESDRKGTKNIAVPPRVRSAPSLRLLLRAWCCAPRVGQEVAENLQAGLPEAILKEFHVWNFKMHRHGHHKRNQNCARCLLFYSLWLFLFWITYCRAWRAGFFVIFSSLQPLKPFNCCSETFFPASQNSPQEKSTTVEILFFLSSANIGMISEKSLSHCVLCFLQ